MAKKKRRITEEPIDDYEFRPKDFDEREFILKDIYGTKISLLMMVLAVIVGVVAAIMYSYDHEIGFYLGTLLSFIVCFGSKKIFTLFGFRADLLENKTMLGNYVMFLALALGICIVFINAPFYN